MANTEPKTEPDNPEQQPTAPINTRTCFLRVSIHCRGCQKKVQKIIQSTPGVKVTDIDMRQQKVTVNLTENIHPDALIQKLVKAGKKAELLWLEPEKPASAKEKKQSKAKDKEKEKDPINLEDGKEKTSVKVENLENQERNRVNNRAHGEVITEDGGKSGAHKDDIVIEVGRTNKNVPASDRTPAAEEPPASESVAGPEKSSGGNKSERASGSSGKKKKSKGQNGNNKDYNLDQRSSDGDAPPRPGSDSNPDADTAPVNRGLPRQHMDQQPTHSSHVTSRMGMQPGFGVANQSPPRQHGIQYPREYYGPPISVVNYNTAYPSSSHTASYYVPQPPPHSSYTYMQPDLRPYPAPGHESQVMMPPPGYNPYPAPQPDSFELFSDENPNACSVM